MTGTHVGLPGSVTNACPKCGAGRTAEMGQSSAMPPTSVLRCEACGHVWMPDSAGRATPLGRTCSKCSSPRMRFVGRSVSGVGYFRCDDCEHLAIDTPPNVPPGSTDPV